MPDPHLRAADADRQAVATRLGQHLAEGRLTVEEYEQRVTAAYAARTYGDLDALFADLPGPAAPRPVVPAAPAPAPAARHGSCAPAQRSVRSAWASWTTVALVVTAIWLLTSLSGGFHHFWPAWVVGPWGAVLLARTLTGGRRPAGGRRPW